jgi:flavin reductase (DIM6/NTAB) family NADH-FMN oxidoreductase RutF
MERIMAKVKIFNDVNMYPMPMTIIGANVDENPTFMAVAWVNRVNFNPPIMGIAVGKNHYTNTGIQTNGTFSINIPGTDLIEKTDYSGLVSGKQVDKSDLFEVFYGELKTAPLIVEAPLNIECRLYDTVSLASNNLFLGEIVAVYTEKKYLTGKYPDLEKIKPFVLTMPDNRYWNLGNNIGRAWNKGKIISKDRQ